MCSEMVCPFWLLSCLCSRVVSERPWSAVWFYCSWPCVQLLFFSSFCNSGLDFFGKGLPLSEE